MRKIVTRPRMFKFEYTHKWTESVEVSYQRTTKKVRFTGDKVAVVSAASSLRHHRKSNEVMPLSERVELIERIKERGNEVH